MVALIFCQLPTIIFLRSSNLLSMCKLTYLSTLPLFVFPLCLETFVLTSSECRFQHFHNNQLIEDYTQSVERVLATRILTTSHNCWVCANFFNKLANWNKLMAIRDLEIGSILSFSHLRSVSFEWFLVMVVSCKMVSSDQDKFLEGLPCASRQIYCISA